MDLISAFGSVTMLSIMLTYFTSIHIHVAAKKHNVGPKDLLSFRLELVHLLLKEVGL